MTHGVHPSDPCRRVVLSLLVVSALSLTACTADGRDDQVVVADSAGVSVVSNFGSDVPLDWRFERRFALGGEESGPEGFYDVDRGNVGVDSAGSIFVLDARAHRVIVFDDQGDHLRTMGREGDGPGELKRPLHLAVRPDGTALVDDIGRGRLIGFASDGTATDTGLRPLPGMARRYWNGSSYESHVRLDTAGVRYELVLVQGSDTTILADFRVPVKQRSIELASCGMGFSGMPPLFAPDQRWDARGSRLAVRSGTAYEIDVFEAGRHAARIRRPIDPLPASTELAVRELGEAMTVQTPAGERRCDPVETVEQRGFEDAVAAIRDLRVDPAGRIWVSRAGPRPEPTPTDIVDPEGTYLGTLPPSAPYPIRFLPDGRALVAETDDLGITRLVVYGVEEVPSGFEPE